MAPWVAALTALACCPLAGCGEDEYKAPASKPVPLLMAGPVSAARDPVVEVPPLPGGSLSADLGLDKQRYGAYSGRDLRDKADVYWKLFWLSKALQEGHPPPQVNSVLQEMRAAVRKMEPDKNVAAISDILGQIEDGLAAQTLEGRLSTKGIRTASLSWTDGESGLERDLKSPVKPRIGPTPRSSRLEGDDIRRAAKFASRHHKPPVLVAQESFQNAADKTQELGDALDEERRQSGEHLIGRDTVDPSAGGGNPFERAFPTRPVR